MRFWYVAHCALAGFIIGLTLGGAAACALIAVASAVIRA